MRAFFERGQADFGQLPTTARTYRLRLQRLRQTTIGNSPASRHCGGLTSFRAASPWMRYD